MASDSKGAFYLSVQQSSSSNLDSPGDDKSAAMTKKTKKKSTWSAKHSASEVVSGSAAKYWSYKTTEITLESGVSSAAADQRVLEPPAAAGSGSSSASTAISGNNNNSSSASPLTRGGSGQPVLSSGGVCSLGGGGGGLHSAASVGEDRHAEGIRNEVKLPKNAVELIAWAITECNTTTPTLTQIATHIQAYVGTYRELELSVLVKMVQHHLNRNNPAFFLPVMSSTGHLAHSPNLARWAINRQVVTVGEDGSLVRRRHRSHAYTSGRRCLPSSSSSYSPTTTTSSSYSRPGSTPATPTFVSTPDGFSTCGTEHFYHQQFASYPGSTDSYFGPPPGPSMGMGPPPPPPPPSSSLTQTPHHLHHHHHHLPPLPLLPMTAMFGTPASSPGPLSPGQSPLAPSALGPPGLYAAPGMGSMGGLGGLPPPYHQLW